MEASSNQQKSLTTFLHPATTSTVSNSPTISKPTSEPERISKKRIAIEKVPGLFLIKDFITQAEETLLWSEVNKLPWTKFGSRYRMLLGWIHDRDNEGKMTKIGDLPESFQFVIDRILEDKIMDNRPEQCVINSYEPGQGISPHIDRVEDFGRQVTGLSLGSDVVMEFIGPKGEKVELLVPRRSIYLMEGDARYKWKHSMPQRKKDKLENGLMNVRKKRISLTFREVDVGFRKKHI